MTSLAAQFTLDNSGFLAKMLENGTVTEREAKRMQKALEYVSSQLKVLQNGSAEVAKQASGMKELAAATETATHFHAGFTRELLVLTHELSQGNYKRFGGSLLVLAEYSGSATKALSALVGPIGLVAGGVGLMTLAFVEGAHESEAFRQSIVKSGNYAGITQGQFNALAKEIATSTTGSIGQARDAIEALISTGQVGPQVLAPLSKAVVLYAKATGETEAKVADDFAKMSDGVAKWAAEQNKSLNFLTTAQYDYIKALENQGRKEQAELVVSQALSDHLKGVLKPNLGYLESAIKTATSAWTSFWDAAKGAGRAQTLQDRLEVLKKELADLDRTGPRGSRIPDSESIGRGRTQGDARASKQSAIAGVEAQIKAQNDLAAAIAKTDEIQKKGIAASDYKDNLLKEAKGAELLTRDLQQLNAQIAASAAAGKPWSQAEITSATGIIKHRDRSVGEQETESETKKLAAYLKERATLYAEETAKLREQESELERYGKILDKTALAAAQVDVTTGRAANASAAQKATLLASAAAEDEAAAKVKLTEEAIRKKTEADKLAKEATDRLNRTLADQSIATDVQIEALQEDARYLGLNTLERKIAIAQLKIEKDLRKELADPKNVGHEAEIQANADSRKNGIAAALRDNDAALKSFSNGENAAFKQYQEDAADAAKFAKNFFDGSLKQTEDALVKFAETGKLSFKDLFAFMADEFIRQQVHMQLASATEGGLGGILSGIGGAFSAVSGFFGFGHKSGLDYVPYDGYPAILHKGERVQTAEQAAAPEQKSVGSTVINNISVGAGVSRGEVAALLQSYGASLKAEILASQRNGGAFAR